MEIAKSMMVGVAYDNPCEEGETVFGLLLACFWSIASELRL